MRSRGDRARGDGASGSIGSGLVTAIEPQRRSARRSNVYVDGRYAFSVEAELAAALRVGEPVSQAQLEALLGDDELARCYGSALHFLAPRPRSEQEVRQRLARHGYPPTLVDRVVEKLRGQKLIDDADFARYWVEQRQAHRPSGARLLKLELRQKGLESEVATEALADLDDPSEGAYGAASKRARALRGLDEQTFRRRLGGFLQRRGFDYAASAEAVSRLWAELDVERGGSGPQDDD